MTESSPPEKKDFPQNGERTSEFSPPADSPPNILILSQWYFPNAWMPLRDLAARLQKDGFHVEVLTAVPYSLADGKRVPGYKIRFRQTETLDGVKVIRLPLYISQDTSGFRRFLCYASFGISAATIGQFGLTRPDIVFCYNLPTLGWAARLFRLLRGTKIVIMVQDLWPESVTGSGMMKSRFLSGVLRRWSRRFYRSADALTGLSPGFRRNLIQRGIRPDRIEVVYNWTDEKTPISPPESPSPPSPPASSSFPPSASPSPSSPPPASIRDEEGEGSPLDGEPRPDGPFIVTYAGNMGIYQGLDVVLDAAKILADRSARVLFRLIGGGVVLDKLKNRAKELGLTNLVFVPPVPTDKIGAELNRSDALLIHLKKIDLFKITIPGKTQASLFAGKPILCGVDGEVSRIVGEAGAGVPFEPENPESLADAVERMMRLSKEELRRMGESGRRYYQKEMSFETGYRTIVSLFSRLTERR